MLKEKNTNKLLSKNIKLLRKKYGISQSQLCKDLGISLSTLQSWEYNTRNCNNINILVKMADYFNVNIEDLAFNENLKEKIG